MKIKSHEHFRAWADHWYRYLELPEEIHEVPPQKSTFYAGWNQCFEAMQGREEKLQAKCAMYEKALDQIRMLANPGRSREDWMIFSRATDALREFGESTDTVRQPTGEEHGDD